MIFQTVPTWEKGSPLAFQSHHYFLYKTQVIKYYSNHKTLQQTDCMMAKIRYTASSIFVFKNETSPLYLPVEKAHSCIMMLLFNMAEPDWISVHCHEVLLCNVLCIAEKSKTETQVNNASSSINIDSFSGCSLGKIILENNCYEFHWRKEYVITKDICRY